MAEHNRENEESLRLRAERLAVAKKRTDGELPTPAEIRGILYELQVHQIELEMQNDELRRNQAELESSRARYFELFDLAPVGYCTVDNKNLILEANLTLGTLLDVNRDALTGHFFRRFIHAGDQDGFYFFQRNVLAGPGPHMCELQLTRGNDHLFWARLEGAASVDKEGAPVCRIAISDISNRKQIEHRLEETSAELERIVNLQKKVISDTREDLDREVEERVFAETELSHRQAALEAVYAMETTADFTMESLYDQIVSSIATTLRIPLVTISEYRGGRIIRGSLSLDGLVTRSGAEKKPCRVCEAVLDGVRPQQFNGDLGEEFKGDLCFDHSRFKSYAGVPVRTAEGQSLGIITVLDDTRREFQDYEIKFIDIFGRYITHELGRRDLESQLRRNEEMHLLGQLTSGVAHEVRNPLNGILAIMGALDKELGNEERFGPYMRHMSTQVRRLTLLMEDLLALGRPVHRESMKKVSMAAIFENALTAWHQTLQASKPVVRFTTPQTPESCMIRADSVAMTQMIINLLENARNHAPADAEIVCAINDHHDGMMTFTITDQGSGISEECLSKIFDPFFTTRKGGTGLGLSIIRTIVENHHGSINASNNTGGPGATFTVILPLYCEMSEQEIESVRALSVRSSTLNSKRRRSSDYTG